MTDTPTRPASPPPTSNRSGWRLSRRWALAALLAVILLNEWTLGPLFAADGEIGGLKLWIVRGFDVSLLLLAAAIATGRFSPVTVYRDTALISFNIIVLIVAGTCQRK